MSEMYNTPNLDEYVEQSDIVVDGTDNFTTRFAINRSCVYNNTPLVSASVIRAEGQLSVFKGYEKNKPCYECLYNKTKFEEQTCSNSGVLSPFAGVIGSLQATLVLKLLTNLGEQLDEKLLLIDAKSLEFRTLKLKKDSNCFCNTQ